SRTTTDRSRSGTPHWCARWPLRTASRPSSRATTWWTPSSSRSRSGRTRPSRAGSRTGWGRWAERHLPDAAGRYGAVIRSRHLPDTHLYGAPAPRHDDRIDTAAALRGLLDGLGHLQGIDAVVHTGDASEDGTAQS